MALAWSFLQATADPSALTTYTFTAQNIGTAATDRYIIVTIAGRRTGTATISSVTVGGIAAAQVVQQTNAATASTVTGIYIAAVPTGTTGDVVVTFSAAMLRAGIGMYRATDIDPTATQTASQAAVDPTATFTVTSGSAIVGVAATGTSSTSVWTGLTANYDAVISASGRHTGASAANVGQEEGRVLLANISDTSEPVGCFAAFRPLSQGQFFY